MDACDCLMGHKTIIAVAMDGPLVRLHAIETRMNRMEQGLLGPLHKAQAHWPLTPFDRNKNAFACTLCN